MDLQFDHIVPVPMAENLRASDIWNANQIFKSEGHYAVLAPSGKGKSTFAHILYGLRKDYSGKVLWEEKNISDYDWNTIQSIRRSKFGIIFQDLRLFEALSAKDNIAIHQEEEKVIDWKRINAWAERLDVLELLDQNTGLLSYGQKQRIAIIRALSRPFKWLIMDEPFSHLDAKNVLNATKLILEISSEYEAGTIITALDQVPELFTNHERLVL